MNALYMFKFKCSFSIVYEQLWLHYYYIWLITRMNYDLLLSISIFFIIPINILKYINKKIQ